MRRIGCALLGLALVASLPGCATRQEELDAEDFVGARLFAVRTLEPDGSFRVPVPADARAVWLDFSRALPVNRLA